MKRLSTLLVSTLCVFIALAQAPANDSCQDAIALTLTTTYQTTTFKLSGATSDETGCRQAEDVWFKFEMPANGAVEIETDRYQLNHDVLGRLYTGTCGSLTPYSCTQNCNNNATYSCSKYLVVRDTSLAGDSVFLRFSKFYSFTSGDSAKVMIRNIPTSELRDNDVWTDATLLPVNCTLQVDTFTLDYAIAESAGSCRDDEDIWFKFEVPANGIFEITADRISTYSDVMLQLFTDTSGALDQYECDSTCGFINGSNTCSEYIFVNDTSIAGDTVFVRAAQFYDHQNGGTFSLGVRSVQDAEVPTNDVCSDAIALNVNSTLVLDTFDLTFAKPETGGTCRDDEDIWFKMEVPANGVFEIVTDRVNIYSNVMIQVFTGTCGSLNQYGCDSVCGYRNITNTCSDYTFINDTSIAGDTIYLRAAQFYDSRYGGPFSIGIRHVQTSELPTNDICDDAIALNTNSTWVLDTFDLSYAIPETGGSCRDDEDVWFKFEVPSNGAFEIQTQRVNIYSDVIMQLFTGTCGSLVQYTCDSTCGFENATNTCSKYIFVNDTSLAGDTLFVRAAQFYDSRYGGPFSIAVKEVPSAALPVNDICSDAILLTPGALDTFDLSYAIPESGGSCRDDEDVWFKFEVPANGAFKVQSERVNIYSNVVLQLFSGSCGSLVQYNCDSTCNIYNVGNSCNTQFLVRDTSLAGDTVYLRAAQFYDSQDGGTFSLILEFPTDPELPDNDKCKNAALLTATLGNCVIDTFNNMNTTYSIVPTNTCGAYYGGDVWFKFEMPSSDDAFVEMSQVGTTSSNYRITAFSGGCDALVEEICNSSGSYPDLSIRSLGLAGDTVLVHVYKDYNNVTGDTFGICVKDTVLPSLRAEVGHYEKNTVCDI
ncbi:MAG: hypothetical protein KJP21_03085, partial [Bacteroidia bacterium]|nr:hypothetical protein [Bacteroidia bacterium]